MQRDTAIALGLTAATGLLVALTYRGDTAQPGDLVQVGDRVQVAPTEPVPGLHPMTKFVEMTVSEVRPEEVVGVVTAASASHRYALLPVQGNPPVTLPRSEVVAVQRGSRLLASVTP